VIACVTWLRTDYDGDILFERRLELLTLQLGTLYRGHHE
jgi:hypothetical protein